MGTNLSRCDAPDFYCEMRLRKERERGYREGRGRGYREKEGKDRAGEKPTNHAYQLCILSYSRVLCILYG